MYAVTMHRYGLDETHNYLLGVFSTLKLARKHAEEEEQSRGGKYEAKISSVALDTVKQRKPVKGLTGNTLAHVLREASITRKADMLDALMRMKTSGEVNRSLKLFKVKNDTRLRQEAKLLQDYENKHAKGMKKQ